MPLQSVSRIRACSCSALVLHPMQAQLWFNLDGVYSPLYLSILPLVLSRDTAKR